MWIDYSIKYIMKNQVTSCFLAGISYLSSVLLSLLGGFFYNLWIDKVHRTILQTGSYTEKWEASTLAYVFVLAAVSISLAAMIHNAFEVSMNSRLHQLGILQSVGATPRQIRSFLLWEALLLCTIPILAGVMSGIGLCRLLMQFIIAVTEPVRRYDLVFQIHGFVIAASIALSAVTVLLSAWVPAGRISRMSPLEAVHCKEEAPAAQMKQYRMFSFVFGITGELARKSIYSRRKALRTSTVSLAFSFLAFLSFLNFEAISGASTQKTYFERYRGVWDLMLTADRDGGLLDKIRKIPGVESCIAYKTWTDEAVIPAAQLSREFIEAERNGLTGAFGAEPDGNYRFSVNYYVLDDGSFRSYCAENGLEAEGQAVLLNRIWDRLNSGRLDRTYLPPVDIEKTFSLRISGKDGEPAAEIAIGSSAFGSAMPRIREEGAHDALSVVLSERLYETFSERVSHSDIRYNVKLRPEGREDDVERQIADFMPREANYTLEKRLEEERSDQEMRNALKFLVGLIAGLLACIGIANVFSSVLGQIYQRKREFARYFSVGLTPRGMAKILAAEAFIISLRPVLLGTLFNIPVILLALRAAELPVKVFWTVAPITPAVCFALFIFLSVCLAYFLGGRRICRGDLTEILKDDTMA